MPYSIGHRLWLKFIFIAFFLVSTRNFLIIAQDLRYTISYTQTTKMYSKCAKGEENLVSNLDRDAMRTITEVDDYIINVYEDSEHETIINHTSSDKFASWINKPFKTVLDKNGVSSFDSK